MTFDEWYTENEPNLDLFNFSEEALQAAFNAGAEQGYGEIALLYNVLDVKNAESISYKQRIAELEAKLKTAKEDSILEVLATAGMLDDCPINWDQATVPSGGFNKNDKKHRSWLVGTMHLSYERINLAAKKVKLGDSVGGE